MEPHESVIHSLGTTAKKAAQKSHRSYYGTILLTVIFQWEYMSVMQSTQYYVLSYNHNDLNILL